MNPRVQESLRVSFPLASVLALTMAAPLAEAATYYWDGNNNTGGFGSASGTWAAPTAGTATSGWTTSSTGATVVNGNSITTLIGDAINFGTDTSTNGLGGGTITVSGTVNAASLRFGSQSTSNITLSGGTINLGAAATIHVGAGSTTVMNIASNITGAGTSLTKTGNSLTLSGTNSYTGSTIISTGTLTLGSTGALGGSTPGVNGTSGVTIGGASGATLASTTDGITVYAPITTANSGVTSTISFSRNANAVGSITLNGAIGGAGNVAFTTPNVASNNNLQTINIGAAATYAGTTTFNVGNVANTLTIKNTSGAANALPATTVLSFGTAAGNGSGRASTLDLNGQNQTLAGLSNGGSVPLSRNQRVTSASAATLTINSSANHTFGGSTNDAGVTTRAQIMGAISLVKNGTGTFTLGGTLTGGAAAGGNTYTGSTQILGGILVLGETLSIQNSAFDTAGSIAGDATNGLRTSVTTLRLGGLTGGNNFSTRFTTTTGGYTGLTALTLNPGTGVTNTYSGDIGDGATGMTLTKMGAGTQVLSGTNTHTGATSVTAGVLAVNGTLANTSTTTVSGTGTLKGGGSVNSNVTIDNGGTLASGTSIESLAVGGNLAFNNGSSFEYELDKDVAPTVAGDLTAVTGSLSLSGTVTLNIVETGTGSWEFGTPLGDAFGSPAADKLTLISYNGTWNGGLFTYLGNLVQDDSGILINGQQWWFNYNDTSAGTNFTGDLGGATRFVTITVPEPGAALLGGIGLLILIRRRR